MIVEGEIYAQCRGLLKATISFPFIDQSFYVDFVIFWTFSYSKKGLDCVQTLVTTGCSDTAKFWIVISNPAYFCSNTA